MMTTAYVGSVCHNLHNKMHKLYYRFNGNKPNFLWNLPRRIFTRTSRTPTNLSLSKRVKFARRYRLTSPKTLLSLSVKEMHNCSTLLITCTGLLCLIISESRIVAAILPPPSPLRAIAITNLPVVLCFALLQISNLNTKIPPSSPSHSD